MSRDERAGTAARAGGPRIGPALGPVPRAKDPRGTLRRLTSYFVRERGGLFVVLGAVAVSSLLGLVGPFLVGYAIDHAVGARDLAALPPIAGAMIATYVSAALLDVFSSWRMAGLSQRSLASLREELFAKLQGLPMRYLDRHASGDLMSRLTSDVDAIQQAVAQNVTSLLASTIAMVGIVVAMFLLSPWLALGALLVVPLLLGVTRAVAASTRRGFKDLQRDVGALTGAMEETLAGQKVITAFQRNEAAIAAFRAHNERVYAAGVAANERALLLMPLTGVLGNLFVIVLVALGGWLALAGLVTVGTIASFVSYGQGFIGPLRQISTLYNTLQAALAGAERVFEVLDEASEVDAPAPERPAPERPAPERPAPERPERAVLDRRTVRGHVTFEDVSFAYTPGRPTLAHMTLDAQPGQTIALVGATGAGKTTILNLLTRFYEIDGGTIRIDGVDIRAIPKAELRAMLGLVLQETFLFGTTVMENLRFGRLDATDDEVREAARLANAEPFILQLPDGYDTVLSERASNLSQGQRQLLAIARTLLAAPPILVLDEATSSVDTRTEANIQRSLLALRRGRTSFVIAHRLSTIRDADQILILDAGRIVERGTHDELLAKGGVYHHLYTSQFKGQAI